MHEMIEKETDLATEVFLRAYDKLDKIHDEVARVSATNGIMVHLEKGGSFSRLRAYMAEKKIKETKMEEPKPEKVEDEKKEEAPPETPVTEEPAPKTFDVDTPVPQKPNGFPEYDVEKECWNYCAMHPKDGINYHSAKDGIDVPYQACFKCHEFLESDGTRKPMKQRAKK